MDTCLKLIRVRLEAISKDEYASHKMARQAAADALKDLESYETQLAEELASLHKSILALKKEME